MAVHPGKETQGEEKEKKNKTNKQKNRMAIAKLSALNANTISQFLSVSHKCIYVSFNIINSAVA